MPSLRLGLILNRDFHFQNRWVSALTPRLVEGILRRFHCCWIQTQQEYESCLGDVEALLSMEPGWAAPRLEFGCTASLREKLASIPSCIFYSDPHDKSWREEYFLENRLDYVLAYYDVPTRRHFRRLPAERIVHFPWAIPDESIAGGPIRLRSHLKIACFGASAHEAYELRNWCRAFPFVDSTTNSGVENKAMTDDEYLRWLATRDAAIAAGSDSARYRLTVPKYFEIPAAGALLFAQETEDLETLGFRDLRNCIVFHRGNFESLAREYLNHPGDFLSIREAGRELIRSRHAISTRLDALERLLVESRERKRSTVLRPLRLPGVPPVRASEDRSLEASSAGCRPERTVDKALQRTHRFVPGEGGRKVEKSSATSVSRAANRPKVLLIVDSPGWAHDIKSRHLISTLGRDFDMRLRLQADVTAPELDEADLLLVYYWVQFGAMPQLEDAFFRNRHKILVGICSHWEFEGERRRAGMDTLSGMATGVFANNLSLYIEFRQLLDVPVFYTPNGVDTDYFAPAPLSGKCGPLRVGWAGSLSNQGPDQRGYRDFIVPATAAVDGVELVTAIREDVWRGPEEMRDWYRSLDVYLCASRSEGTPNPCLEAAANGVPLLTTRVGNMPELVRHGVNGLFIERDVQDIASKLALLRDNPSLRKFLGASAREAIRLWDWKLLAENYRAMFEAVLGHRAVPRAADSCSAPSTEGTTRPPQKGPASLFSAPAELYLASADRMDRVLENLDRMKGAPVEDTRTYATVIGGLSGLNYLLALRPQRIVFFDRNLSAVDYARLIIEMIGLSKDREDFMGRMFCRPLDAFLADTGAAALTVGTQEQYLERPVDRTLQADTLSKLSPVSRQIFNAYMTPYLPGKTLEEVRNCRRLLPCWPIGKMVPVGGGEAEGIDELGQRVPNTNTFFYGLGWLSSPESFLKVKQAISRADVQFAHVDLLKQDLRCLSDPSLPAVLHVSNIDDWFPEAWALKAREWERLVLSWQGRLTIVTSHNGIRRLDADPHDRAYAALAPFVYGQVVEVTHKVPWGFHEISRKNVSVDAYLAHPYPTDTTILHILMGEGTPRETFGAACRKAISQSRRVVVLEHNRASSDWRHDDGQSHVTEEELQDLLRNAAGNIHCHLTHTGEIAGETDSRRNLLAVIDISGDIIEAATLTQDTRPAGYSFCIITNGKRPEKLAREIQSIRALNLPAFEILLGGDVPPGIPDVRIVPLPDAAAAGRLGEMRNRLIWETWYDHIVVADDDMIFHEDFHDGLRAFGENYDVLCVRILNPDGTRFWDWATCGGPTGHRLLAYNEHDPYVYPTGGLCVMKAAVSERVAWDDSRGFYQGEDVDFARRLREAGIRIKFCRYSTVTHDDPGYTQVDDAVLRRENLLGIARDRYAGKNISDARYFLHRATRLSKTEPLALQETVSTARDHGDAEYAEYLENAGARKEPEGKLKTAAPGAPACLQGTPSGKGLEAAWAAPFLNFCGYGSFSRDSVTVLDRLGARIQAIPFNNDQKFIAQLDDQQKAFWDRIVNRQIAVDTLIVSSPPVTPSGEDFYRATKKEYPTFRAHIGYTMNETARISAAWVDSCNNMDEIWVPSTFNQRTFVASGFPEEKIFVMPLGVDTDMYNSVKVKPFRPREYRGFVFLSIFEWSLRKGWDVLLKAYHSCFQAKDDVTLAIRAYRGGQSADWIRQQIALFQESLPLRPEERPHIVVLDRFVAPRDLPSLYAGADAFVLPSRGEGWGLPYIEAMAMGIPAIGTNWSGNLDFMTPGNSFLIDCKETAVPESGWRDNPNAIHYKDQVWAEPSVHDLERVFWEAAKNPEEARKKGEQARRDVLANFTVDHAAHRIAKRLHDLDTRCSARKQRRTAKPTSHTRTAIAPEETRVLFQARKNVFSLPGGDSEVLLKLKSALEVNGVTVDFSSISRADLGSYDIVHIFNSETSFAVNAALQEKPFVMTPLYEDFGKYVRNSFEAVTLMRDYMENGEEDALECGLAGIRHPAEGHTETIPQDSFLRFSDAAFASGAEEGQRIRRDFPGIGGIHIVPLGFNRPEPGVEISPERFVAEYGVRDFILCVGRLETRKNQLMLQYALQDVDIPIVFVNGKTIQPEYEDLCRRFRRKGRTIFTGRLSSEMLYSAFSAAKVHALPSWFELPGLVSLEAAWFGCNIVGADSGTLRDYLGDSAFYCNPGDPASIKTAVMAAYEAPKDLALRDLAGEYTWERTARAVWKAYGEIASKCATKTGRRMLREKVETVREEINIMRKREQTLVSCENSPNETIPTGSAILKLRPSDSGVHYAMGLAHLRRMDYPEAVHHFTQHLRLDPFGTIDAYLFLALALIAQKRHADAVGCLLSARNRHPFMGDKARGLVHEYLGICSRETQGPAGNEDFLLKTGVGAGLDL